MSGGGARTATSGGRRRSAMLRPRVLVALAVAGAVAAACVVSSTTRPRALATDAASTYTVTTAVKAHLTDGSTVVFPEGVRVGGGAVEGSGRRFAPTLAPMGETTRVPLDSVLGMEAYSREVNPGRTILYSTASVAASYVGAVVLAIAIFGSCPTVYVDSAGTQVLQAESFSYSIAPLLEKRDVDLLRATPKAGVVQLDVRNEALETHFTDHLELVEVRHRADERALPAARRGPVAVRDLRAPATARDGAGRDVLAVLRAADGAVFGSDDAVLDRAIAGTATEDHLELAAPRVPGRDSLAVVLRARSSLLSTVAFYDHMLTRPGARALDWIGSDLGRITSVAQLATWYGAHMGLRVSVRERGEWRQVARLMDFGPAAWRDIAVVVPATERDSVRIRLSFVPDAFRIDEAAFAWDVRDAEQRMVPVARATDGAGAPRADVAAALRRADDRRLETRPGHRYLVEFDVGAAAPGTRTYMLAAQGYYTEWVRGSWIAAARDSTKFSPSRATIRDVLRSWRASRDSMERRFFRDRVPIV